MKTNWWFFLGVVSVPFSIIFASGLAVGYSKTPQDVFSIYLSIIAVGVSFAIFAFQQSQGEKIQVLINNVNSISSLQKNLLDDVRSIYADQIVKWVIEIHKHANRPNDLYEKEVKGKLARFNEEARNKIVTECRIDLQSLRPRIITLELVKTFGKESVEHLNKLFFKCDYTPSIYDNYVRINENEATRLLVEAHSDCMKESKKVADIFLQYCSKETNAVYQQVQ